MTEAPPGSGAPPSAAAWATLDAATVEELMPFGEVRSVARGAVLYRAGEEAPDFFVVLEGEAEIVRETDGGDVLFCFIGAVPATAWLGDCVAVGEGSSAVRSVHEYLAIHT
jgi:hypothetical protein